MFVIKCARWGERSAHTGASRLCRMFSHSSREEAVGGSPNFQGPYLPKEPSINPFLYSNLNKNRLHPTSETTSDLNSSGEDSHLHLVIRRHLHLLKKYQNQSSLRLVADAMRDLPLHLDRNAESVQQLLACVERIDLPETPESLQVLLDIYCWITERGIRCRSESNLMTKLAQTIVARLPKYPGVREYNRNFARFIEALASNQASLVAPSVRHCLPALSQHTNSLLMTEQFRIATVCITSPDLDTDTQAYLLSLFKSLGGYCELFDFSELQYVLESLLALKKSPVRLSAHHELETSLLHLVANLERRFVREILGPVHNPVAYTRCLALVTELGATDVSMQLLKDKLERVVLPRHSVVKFMGDRQSDLSHASRAQRSWILRLVEKQSLLYECDSEQSSQSRMRENKRKTDVDVRNFCSNLLGSTGMPYVVCPVKLMNLARWKASQLKESVLLDAENASLLEQIIAFNLKSLGTSHQSQDPQACQASWLKNQLTIWKNTLPESSPSKTEPKLLQGASSDKHGPTKFDLSAAAVLYEREMETTTSN